MRCRFTSVSDSSFILEAADGLATDSLEELALSLKQYRCGDLSLFDHASTSVLPQQQARNLLLQ